MKREVLLAVAMLLWATYCASGQGIAEAAAPGPAPLARSSPAPASGPDDLGYVQKFIQIDNTTQKLNERVKSIETSLGVLQRKLDAYAAMPKQLTPDQDKRVTALEVKVSEIKKTIAEANANAAKQPTLAATQAKDHVCNCGPNCRCVGTCNCRWAGECLQVPDPRPLKSVVTQPATTVVRRVVQEPVYYVPRQRVYYGNGVYGWTGGNCVNGVCY